MTKIQITRHTSTSLTGRRMMQAKGSRVVSSQPIALSAEQIKWNEEVERKKAEKEKNGGKR